MGAVNYGTSDYITLGIQPLTVWDVEQDESFVDEVKKEMEEYDDLRDLDEYLQDYVNQCMQDDCANIEYELDRYSFEYFTITIKPGYYDGFYLDIANALPDEMDDDERREAREEVKAIEQCLTDCAGMGLQEVFPGWVTAYNDYNTTVNSIKKACAEMLKEVNETPHGIQTRNQSIKQLPSGYYSVWIDDNWIEASAPTQEAAEKVLSEYLTKYGKQVKQ